MGLSQTQSGACRCHVDDEWLAPAPTAHGSSEGNAHPRGRGLREKLQEGTALQINSHLTELLVALASGSPVPSVHIISRNSHFLQVFRLLCVDVPLVWPGMTLLLRCQGSGFN